MKRVVLVLAAGLLLAISGPWPPQTAVAQQTAQPATPEELAVIEAQITDAHDEFVRAYNASDVDAIAGLFTEDARFAGTLQPFWLEGVDDIRDLWARYFIAFPAHNLIRRQPRVRAYGGVTAVETGYMEMYMGDEQGRLVPTYMRYSRTWIRTDAGWRIAVMHVSRLPGTD